MYSIFPPKQDFTGWYAWLQLCVYQLSCSSVCLALPAAVAFKRRSSCHGEYCSTYYPPETTVRCAACELLQGCRRSDKRFLPLKALELQLSDVLLCHRLGVRTMYTAAVLLHLMHTKPKSLALRTWPKGYGVSPYTPIIHWSRLDPPKRP